MTKPIKPNLANGIDKGKKNKDYGANHNPPLSFGYFKCINNLHN